MVYTRATWQLGVLSAGKGRAFRAVWRWLPAALVGPWPLCVSNRAGARVRGVHGPKRFCKWAPLLLMQLARTQAAAGEAIAGSNSELETRNPALALRTAAARQQRGFQAPTAQEGILEQTLRLPRRVFTE